MGRRRLPQRLKQEEIPLFSRIIALAEHYDRISEPCDSEDVKKQEIIKYIRENSGKRFDPVLVEKFIMLLQKQ